MICIVSVTRIFILEEGYIEEFGETRVLYNIALGTLLKMQNPTVVYH